MTQVMLKPLVTPAVETVEVKHRQEHYLVDESLSEWELARMTSKTWSMEQD